MTVGSHSVGRKRRRVKSDSDDEEINVSKKTKKSAGYRRPRHVGKKILTPDSESEEDKDNVEMSVCDDPMHNNDVLLGMWVVVKYEGEKFLGKVMDKKCGEYLVRCLNKPFGISTPQTYESDEGIYYTEVYQTDVTPENKQIMKDGKKSREYYWVY